MTAQPSQKKPDWLESPKFKALVAVLPKVPLLTKVALLHLLRMSDGSRYLDLKSELIIALMRSFLNPARPASVSKTQATTLRDPGIKGRIWVSKVAARVPPENHIRDTLLAVIETMREDRAGPGLSAVPEIAPVEAEWTGYRARASPDATLPPALSEAERYAAMMRECGGQSPSPRPTILYFHGGAYYLCDPATHRPLTKKLAKLTGGRVYSVRYRLAPQHPFPSALLDALVSYFTLLYPPPGSVHEAVPAGEIVFGGDSAGGNLSLALLQTLLEIRRQGRKINWFGEAREVPLPAGVTACSPWIDLVESMPSWESNAKWDYLPPEGARRPPPPDAAWPARPPRQHLYVDDAYRLHPLASLQFAPSWAGAPPVYVCCGWECLADEARFAAAQMARHGAPVAFEEYEAMPHVGCVVLPGRAESRRNVRGWAEFIVAAVDSGAGSGKRQPPRAPSFTTIRARTLEEVPIDPARLSPYSERDVAQMARDRVGREPPVPEARVKL